MSSDHDNAEYLAVRETLARIASEHDFASIWQNRWQRLPLRTPRVAAVLVLFGVLNEVPASAMGSAPIPAGLDVLLLARAASLSAHPGQVAFPGGRAEPTDDSIEATALREAEEETGLDPSGVEILGRLAAAPIPASGHVVTPVLGWWTRPIQVGVVDAAESADVFRVPVADLIAPDHRVITRLSTQIGDFDGPGFLVPTPNGERLVWGFTAIILNAIFGAAGWTEPWPNPRIIELEPGDSASSARMRS